MGIGILPFQLGGVLGVGFSSTYAFLGGQAIY